MTSEPDPSRREESTVVSDNDEPNEHELILRRPSAVFRADTCVDTSEKIVSGGNGVDCFRSANGGDMECTARSVASAKMSEPVPFDGISSKMAAVFVANAEAIECRVHNAQSASSTQFDKCCESGGQLCHGITTNST
ncbi:hypothetical protein BLNAU_23349 [Blattamonas nauphoetae]|uniref:Uncharacterized protein n=1 Tax=Blattamonas nauphoetae TaxID=2049346 RepID=A0ABQ9WSL5_9EUKA|nr:hypothetical protein BLNAU_23349 [Blattamonas nauphoetae]